MGFFDKLKEGLAKTRTSISNGLDTVFGDYSQVDDEFFENLEEVLIMADVGMTATDRIISRTITPTKHNIQICVVVILSSSLFIVHVNNFITVTEFI